MKKILTSLLLVALFFAFSGEASAQTVNRPPVADAGLDRRFVSYESPIKETFMLFGVGSFDPDGNTLSYTWSQISGPSATSITSFTYNARVSSIIPGRYEFKLKVSDGTFSSEDIVAVTVETQLGGPSVKLDYPNGGEVYKAGTNLIALVNTNVYEQSHYLSLVSETNPKTEFDIGSSYIVFGRGVYGVIPATTTPGMYKLKVRTYNKGTWIEDVSDRSIRIDAPFGNQAPVARAGNDVNLVSYSLPTREALQESLHFSGSGSSDPNNDRLYYYWSQTSGPTRALLKTLSIGDSTVSISALYPGRYEFKLKVSDGTFSSEDTVVVNVTYTIPALKIISPNGGEVIQAGSNLTAKFDSNIVNKYHEVELISELGPGNNRRIGQGTLVTSAGTNQITGMVPATTTPGRYRARVSFGGVASDLSDSSIKVVAPSTVATTVPVVTFISSNADKTIVDGGSDIGEFEIKLKIEARGGDMYVSSNFNPRISTVGNRQVSQDKYTSLTKTLSGGSKTAAGNYLIKDGEDEVFTVTVIGRASDLGGTDSYRADLVGFAYGTRDVSTGRSFHSLNHTVFKTNLITLFNPVTPPPPPTPVLKVISPNGGEYFKIGDSMTVKWDKGTCKANEVSIVLRNESGFQGPIDSGDQAVSTSNDGSHTWTIGNIGDGGKYRVRVLCDNIGTTRYYDDSDGTFVITKVPVPVDSSISISSPNASDIFALGSRIKVEWTTKNIASTEKLLIRLRSVTTGQEYNLVSGVLNDQNESITLSPSLPVGYYTLEIKSSQSVIGKSGAFKISTPTTTTQPVASGMYATLVSTNSSVSVVDGANNDTGLFSIKYKIKAVGTDLYIPGSTGAVSYVVDKGGVAISSSAFTTVLTDLSDSSKTANGNYVIKNGEEKTFEFAANVPMNTTNTAGQYRLSINGLRWRSTDTTGSPNTTTTGLENFKTNYQNITSFSDRASQIASIQATLDILIQALKDLKN